MTVTKHEATGPSGSRQRTDVRDLVALLASVATQALALAREQAAGEPQLPRDSRLASALQNVDAFIHDLASAHGFLTVDEGRDLAEAKAYRGALRREQAARLAPLRERTRRWREAAVRLERALRKQHRLADDLARLKLLHREITPLAPLLEPDARRTLHAAARRIAAAERHAGAAAAAAAAAAATPAAPAGAHAPPDAEPPIEKLRTYLPDAAELEFDDNDAALVARLARGEFDAPGDYRLNLAAMDLSLAGGFESLLCLPMLKGVEHYPFQIRTALQVMRGMRGRALLCDEVGLGKTIEAGIILKEYLVRGLARKVLVLAPPALVGQWREELRDKFDLAFVAHDDAEFRARGAAAWEHFPLVIASLHSAKNAANSAAIHQQSYDLMILDEAHHVRNRNSLNWKFVNRIRSRFALLLTATPVQNDMDELFNLITLLSPGQLKTPAQFRREFVERGDRRRPRNRTKLRELLMDVMVRNSRSQVSVALPPRRAFTRRLELGADERALYQATTRLVRAQYAAPGEPRIAGNGSPTGRALVARTLLAEAGSSAAALGATLLAMRERNTLAGPAVDELCAAAAAVTTSAKAGALVSLLRETSDKVLVFTQYRATQRFLLRTLEQAGVAAARFDGDLSAAEKDAQVAAFAGERRVLLSTDAGSEGRNLQFCHTLVNYDLPWNPMRIEQRVGRLHRIGQSEPVRIINLSARDTVEDHVLEVLDQKINMFELVVGEIGEILGNLEDEREFENIVLDLWAGAPSDVQGRAAIHDLGSRLAEARSRYATAKAYDEELFGQEFAPEQ
jgi:superfamily II DNA or RNA helicase